MNGELLNLKNSLTSLHSTIPDSAALPGWNLIQFSQSGMKYEITKIMSLIDAVDPEIELSSSDLNVISEIIQGIGQFTATTVSQWIANSGHGPDSLAAIAVTLQRIRFLLNDINPIFVNVDDSQALPTKLARRVKLVSSRLAQIEPEIDAISYKLDILAKAEKINDELPIEIEDLKQVKSNLDKIINDSNIEFNKIVTNKNDSKTLLDQIERLRKESKDFTDQLSDLHRIGTSTALGSSFNKRADELHSSMKWWVFILIVSLITGLLIGSSRLEALNNLLSMNSEPYKIIITVIFSFIGIGGPIWIALIATKQIGQRFKLAEDYYYKASISNAYEGYRREAESFDNEIFEAKLFGSALNRFDEIPLRLIEKDTYGSPLQEFINSPIFQRQLESSEDFKKSFIAFIKRITSKFPGSSEPKEP
ncbi:hypothetical protein LG201_04300 [Methylobacillus gramineus]|uniref:hypothetical protein n=1 Tax=Methylobacillus gramineus TaxID=755169 RepID=UPI001CFF5C85|nr:hypothetical protein [Methylobacillus gramineus]MCB5184421.1 hypothetical protein [Methylobacillus gramineus]